VRTNPVNIVDHQKVADRAVKQQESGPPNIGIGTLIPFHVRVQPIFGNTGNEVNIGHDPFGRCKGQQIGGDYVFSNIRVSDVAYSFHKEQKEIKMLGGKDGKGANGPPTRDERLLHRLYEVLGSFDGVQKVVGHLLVCMYFSY
jgi:hypothetical protein